jgi:hypothetical protein
MLKIGYKNFMGKNNLTNKNLYTTSKMHYAGYWALTFCIKKIDLLYNLDVRSV